MYETFITFLIFVGVIAVTALVFCVWAAAAIVRGFLRVVAGVLGMGHRGGEVVPTGTPQSVRCGRPGCAAPNPASARFCRRCGRGLGAPDRVAASAW